jgi:hypothetical protein
VPQLSEELLDDYAQRARHELVNAARRHLTVSYGFLMRTLGGPGRAYIAQVLEKVAEAEHAKGRPPLTAIVVHESQKARPGAGFWTLSMTRDVPKAEHRAFWQDACAKVFAYPWQDD